MPPNAPLTIFRAEVMKIDIIWIWAGEAVKIVYGHRFRPIKIGYGLELGPIQIVWANQGLGPYPDLPIGPLRLDMGFGPKRNIRRHRGTRHKSKEYMAFHVYTSEMYAVL